MTFYRSIPSPNPSPRLREGRQSLPIRSGGRFRGGMSLLVALILVTCWGIVPTIAQDTIASDNEVNAVAEKMYCPVCENIPLDECHTITCIEWKEEIRNQLSDGATEREVIDSFIARFGDHVVGTPQDPVLRALTIITPILTVILAMGAGIYTFTRFSKHQKLKLENEAVISSDGTKSDDQYRQQLEQDLLTRR